MGVNEFHAGPCRSLMQVTGLGWPYGSVLGDGPRLMAKLKTAELATIQRRASDAGVIMVTGQKIALGPIHAGQAVTVHVAAETITIDLGIEDTRTVCRTTTQPVRRSKPTDSASPPMFLRQPVKHVLGPIR